MPHLLHYAKPEDGLFAGADLEGVEIDFNSDGNLRAYGAPLSAYQTLFETKDIPQRIKIFHDALNQFAPPKKLEK